VSCTTVKDGPESLGTRTREKLRWRGPAAYTKDRPVLSSERVPNKDKTVTVMSHRWSSTPRLKEIDAYTERETVSKRCEEQNSTAKPEEARSQK
jgi:hypothetical protein